MYKEIIQREVLWMRKMQV